MSKLEDRLALLEHRMALLESPQTVATEGTPYEQSLSHLGLAYLLEQAHKRLVHEPHFNGYDDFLEGVFKCKITNDNRMECAYKLMELHTELLKKAADVYYKSKKR